MRWRPLDADVVFEVEEKLPVIEHGEVIARVNGAPWLVVNHPELGVALFSMNSEQCERKINEAEKKKLDELFNWVQQEFIELDEVSAASETATHRENHGRRKSIRKSHGTNIKVRSSFIVAKEINSNNQPHQVSLNYIGMLSTYDLDIQDCSIVQISKNVLCCVIVNTIHVQRFFIELAIPSDGNCELIDSSRITSNKWPINCRAIQIIPFSEFASLSPSFQVNYFPLLVVQNSGQLGFISSSGKLHFVNSFSDLRWMDIRIAANRTIYLQDASTGSWKGFFVELFPCNEVFRECVFSCIRILPSEIAFQCLDFFILCDYSSHSLEEEICNAYWYYFSCLLFSIFQGTAFLAEHVLPYDVIDLQLSFQYRYQIFEILHLVCESLKLTSIHSEYSSLKLRSLIVLLSRLLNLKDYSEFYEMDGSIELNGFPKLPQNIQTTFGSLISPFSVYSWVRSLLSADEHVLIEFPSVLFKYFIGLRDSKLFHMTRICLVLSQLVSKICLKEISMFITRCISFDDPVASLAILSELSVCSRCFFMMLMFDLTREDIELLPTSINLILMDFLESCALNPVARINFEELNRISEFLSLEESVMRSKIYKLIGRQDLYQTYSLSWASFEESSKTAAFKQFFEDDQESVSGMRMDGTLSLAERDISLLLFPEDCRLFEVARLISSCRVIPLRLKNSDLSVLNDPQERLRPLIDHSVSKCIGRAIFTLNSYTASLVETISVPEFCLTARVLPRNTLIRFNVDEAPSEFLLWPNFHNGVAHALRIDFAEKTSSREDITRSWVLSSCKRIKDPYTEGGFLLGLGLKRYLRTLRKSDLYNLLAKKEDGVTIGLLLGLAADRRASKDFVSFIFQLRVFKYLPLFHRPFLRSYVYISRRFYPLNPTETFLQLFKQLL